MSVMRMGSRESSGLQPSTQTANPELVDALRMAIAHTMASRAAVSRNQLAIQLRALRKKTMRDSLTFAETFALTSASEFRRALDSAPEHLTLAAFNQAVSDALQNLLIDAVNKNNPTLFSELYVALKQAKGKVGPALKTVLEENESFVTPEGVRAIVEGKDHLESAAVAADLGTEILDYADETIGFLYRAVDKIKHGAGNAFRTIANSRAIPLVIGGLAVGVALYELVNNFNGSGLNKLSVGSSFVEAAGTEVGFAMLALRVMTGMAGLVLVGSAISGIVSSVAAGFEARREYREVRHEYRQAKQAHEADPTNSEMHHAFQEKEKAFLISRALRNAAYKKVGLEMGLGVVLLVAASIVAFPAVILGGAAAAIGATGVALISFLSFLATSVVRAVVGKKIDKTQQKAIQQIDEAHPGAFDLNASVSETPGHVAADQAHQGRDFLPALATSAGALPPHELSSRGACASAASRAAHSTHTDSDDTLSETSSTQPGSRK